VINSTSSFKSGDVKFDPVSIKVNNEIVFENYIDLSDSSLKKS
jgi:hypothetical protein